MAAVSGTLGGQPVVLDNMASEETLKAILAALKGQAKAGATAAGAGGGGDKGVSGLGKAASAAGESMGVLGKVAGMATGGLGFVFKALTGIGGMLLKGFGAVLGAVFEAGKALAKLGMEAMDGHLRMSQFFDAFKDMPIVGTVAGLFAQLAKIQEEELDAFRRMSKTGVGFEGDLRKIRTASLDMGVSLTEFTGIMKNAQDTFRGLGGNAEDGAKAFVKLSSQLRQSGAGDSLRALGMSAEDSANEMALFVRNNGGLTAAQKKDYQGVANSVAEYAKQTDRLAKLTGQSSEEIEKKMAKEAQDEAWQATLQGMDEKDREAANEALKVALATGGQGAVDALKAKMMGLPPMTEAGQNFVSMSGEASKRLEEMEAVTKSNMSAEEKRQKLEELGAKLQLDRAHDAEKIGIKTLQAMAAQGDQNAIAMLKASNDMSKAGITTYEGAVDNLKKVNEAQEKQMHSAAAMAANAENDLQAMGKAIYAVIGPLLDAVMPLMNGMVKTFTDWISGPNGQARLEQFGSYVKEMIGKLVDYGKNLFSKEGRDKIMNDVMFFFKNLWIDIKLAIAKSIPGGSLFFDEKDAKAQRDALDKEKEAMDTRAKAATENAMHEGDIAAAKLKMEQGGIAKAEEAQKKLLNDNLAEKEKLNKMEDSEAKRDLIEKLALKEKEYKDNQRIIDSAKNMKEEQAKQQIADAAKNKAIVDEQNKKLAAPANPKPDNNSEDFDYSTAMATGGSLSSGKTAMVGEQGPEIIKGPASVTSTQETKNLIDGQNAVVAALNMLNMQTAKLIALNAEQEKHQKVMSDKLAWTGNLFE